MVRFATSWGETAEERARRFPCDDLIAEPQQAAWRAIDVDAPAALVWRWLCQLRVAPYSYDWIDNGGRRSPEELTPGLDELEVGQPAVAFFVVGAFERDRSITLYAATSPFGELAISYLAVPTAADRSRIVVKLLVVPAGRIGSAVRVVPMVGDLIMMRKQLKTLRRLAERDARRA